MEKERNKVSSDTSSFIFEFSPALRHPLFNKVTHFGHLDVASFNSETQEVPEVSANVEVTLRSESDMEYSRHAQSTLADALAAPVHNSIVDRNDYTSQDSTVPTEVRMRKPPTLSISSLELIRKCFTDASPIRLPQGHMTIALNREQITSIVKAVAVETAKASFDMLNSAVLKASLLSMRDSPWYCSRNDLPSSNIVDNPASPRMQTLADLRHEAVKDKSKIRNRGSAQVKSKRSGKGVARSTKIMREEQELFEGMTWTRTFVSGPMDPRWNPSKCYS